MPLQEDTEKALAMIRARAKAKEELATRKARITEARKAHVKAQAPARRAYRAALREAKKVYLASKAQALEEYRGATAPTLAALKEAMGEGGISPSGRGRQPQFRKIGGGP